MLSTPDEVWDLIPVDYILKCVIAGLWCLWLLEPSDLKVICKSVSLFTAGFQKLKKLLSFAIGGLLGDVFLHLLPEAWAHTSTDSMTSPLFMSHCSFSLLVLFNIFLMSHLAAAAAASIVLFIYSSRGSFMLLLCCRTYLQTV